MIIPSYHHTLSSLELKRAIACQENNKAVGTDHLPIEIFKQNKNAWSNILHKLYNNIINNDMPNGWKQGIITYLQKRI